MDTKIQEYLKNYKNEKHVLLLNGPSNSGKSTYLKNLLEEDYDIKIFNYIDFFTDDKKVMKTILQMNNCNNLMFSLMKKKSPLVIIREVDLIKEKTLKEILTELNIKKKKSVKTSLKIPIILIGSGNCTKIQKTPAKMCVMVKFENKDIEQKSNTELYKNVKSIFSKYTVYKTCQNYYNLEKILLPLMLHENYKKYILANVTDNDKRFEIIKKISKVELETNELNEFIFNNHAWGLQNIFVILNCHNISHILNNEYNIQSTTDINLDYTKLLIKSSKIYNNFIRYKKLLSIIKFTHNFDKMLVENMFKNITLSLMFDKNKTPTYKKMKNINLTVKDVTKIISFTNAIQLMDDKKEVDKIIKNN